MRKCEIMLAANGGHGDYSGNEVTSLDLSQEPAPLRDRYGRDVFGQSDVAGQVNLGHTPEAEDLAQFVTVGQVLRRGH